MAVHNGMAHGVGLHPIVVAYAHAQAALVLAVYAARCCTRDGAELSAWLAGWILAG